MLKNRQLAGRSYSVSIAVSGGRFRKRRSSSKSEDRMKESSSAFLAKMKDRIAAIYGMRKHLPHFLKYVFISLSTVFSIYASHHALVPTPSLSRLSTITSS